MAQTSAFTDEEKARLVELARDKGRKVAGKKAGVSTTTISHWAKALGVTLTNGAREKAAPEKKAARKKRGKKRTAVRAANGKANGYAIPPAASGFDALEIQLNEALQGVQSMRAAFRQVFG